MMVNDDGLLGLFGHHFRFLDFFKFSIMENHSGLIRVSLSFTGRTKSGKVKWLSMSFKHSWSNSITGSVS